MNTIKHIIREFEHDMLMVCNDMYRLAGFIDKTLRRVCRWLWNGMERR